MPNQIETVTAAWLAELRKQKQWAEHAVAQVPDEKLHQAIVPGTNTVSIIMKHLAGSLRSRFTDFLTTDGEKDWRNRDAEFAPGGETREEIITIWNHGWQTALDAIGALREADLDRTVTIRSQPHTVPEAVTRAVAHCACHTGQIMQISRILAGNVRWNWATIAPGKSEEFRQEMKARFGLPRVPIIWIGCKWRKGGEVGQMSNQSRKRVVIDFNVDDQWPDISRFLDRASTIVSPANREQWILDCSRCAYLGPDAAVLIAGLYERDMQRGLHPEVLLPNEPRELDAFCAFVGLKQRVQKGERPNPDHHLSETVPIHTFYQPIANAQRQVLTLVHRHFQTLSEDAEDALGVAINEVVQNVCDHAESPIGALMAGRYFQKRRDVRVAVLDLGLGIPHTLSRKVPEAKEPERALRLVVKGGVSSHSNPNNMGQGIRNLVDQVRIRRGALLLLSSKAAATMGHDGTVRYHQAPVDFPGTAVFFRMAMDDDDT